MQPRLNLVTLGVADLERARRFYVEGLGFTASSQSNEHVVFMDAGRVALALWGRKELAEDAKVGSDAGGGFRGFSLAHNVGSNAEVDAFLEKAKNAGAKLLKAGESTSWGGYSGYFADPDGFIWEVAHNPFWPLDEQGLISLPK